MRRGYRNPTQKLGIQSEVEQFNFSLKDTHLIVDFDWISDEKLAAIERVNIYLRNGVVIKNIFIVNAKLAYYYEPDWYYQEHIKSDPPTPEKNIFERFKFNKNDVLSIVTDNNPIPAKFDIWYKLALFKYNPLDSKKSIEKNIFVEIKKWTTLPHLGEADVIYQKKEIV
jgi:hypothetical protein